MGGRKEGEQQGPEGRGDTLAGGRGNTIQGRSGNNAAPARFTALHGRAVRAGEGKTGDMARAWLSEGMCSCYKCQEGTAKSL